MSSQWNERYGKDEFVYGTEPNDFLKEHAASHIKQNGKVLCLAEGEGRNAVFLARLGYQVTAVDQSSVGLAKAEKLAAQHGVKITMIVADLADFEIQPGTWDAIVSIWCHVPPSLRSKLHAQVVDGLASGGVLILESYHPRQLEFKTGGPPVPELMMTKETLTNELKGSVQFVVLQEIDRVVQEGTHHYGQSAVTQCLVKKL